MRYCLWCGVGGWWFGLLVRCGVENRTEYRHHTQYTDKGEGEEGV